MNANELEEEFFRVEGRPAGSFACEYVYGLARTPDGDRITAKDRAALWYIAYTMRDGAARISVANLSAHLDCGVPETRALLFHLVRVELLAVVSDTMLLPDGDAHVYVFPQLRKGPNASA